MKSQEELTNLVRASATNVVQFHDIAIVWQIHNQSCGINLQRIEEEETRKSKTEREREWWQHFTFLS